MIAVSPIQKLASRFQRAKLCISLPTNDEVDRGPANQPSTMSAIDRTFDRTICYRVSFVASDDLELPPINECKKSSDSRYI
jgi:hypothetical protein